MQILFSNKPQTNVQLNLNNNYKTSQKKKLKETRSLFKINLSDTVVIQLPSKIQIDCFMSNEKVTRTFNNKQIIYKLTATKKQMEEYPPSQYRAQIKKNDIK